VDRALDIIREEGLAFKTVGGNEAAAMAVPVYGGEGVVIAALGLNMPMARFKGANKKRVVEELKKGAERMSGILSR
jgi:DNA-binding IclR family transcriptional regulator